MSTTHATLQGKHIRADGSRDTFWTIGVPLKDAPMMHHKAGLTWTATGYGKAIPTRNMVYFNGRWRRVYCTIYSNSGTCWIRAPKGEEILVEN